MPLIVEDGSIVANADSFQLVSDLDAYHTKYGNTTWTGDDTTIKEPASHRFMRWLVSQEGRMQGRRVSVNQTLPFPRYGMVDLDGNAISSTTIPTGIINLQAEGSLIELVTPGTLQPSLARGDMIKRKKVVAGPITTEKEYFEGAPGGTSYEILMDLLGPFLVATDTLILN